MARGSEIGDPESLQQRIAESEAVVTGHVSGVTIIPRSTGFVSFHDPVWTKAEIAIDSVERGNVSGNKVAVVFPASTDVQWWWAPKFHEGRQAYGFSISLKQQKSRR